MDNYLRLSQISSLTGVKRHTLNARLKPMLGSSTLARNSANQILLQPSQVKELIGNELLNNKGKIIYIGNLKGGVGKTTLAYLISNATSLLGLKTCVLDLDVQANLTKQYIELPEDACVFFDLIEKNKNIHDITIKISDTLDIIPSSLKNSLIEKSLTLQSPRHQLNWLRNLCLDYLKESYDIIIVDTPPHLATLNSVFCLCLDQDDHLVIPVCAEDFSMMGVKMLLEDSIEIRESYSVQESTNFTVIMNRFFQNQKTNLEMLVKMGQEYQDILSEVVIRDSAKIRELMNNKIKINKLKQGREIYEQLNGIMQDLNILKRI